MIDFANQRANCGDSNVAEGDAHGGKLLFSVGGSQAVESGDGALVRNGDSEFLEGIHEVVGLVVCGADPGGDTFAAGVFGCEAIKLVEGELFLWAQVENDVWIELQAEAVKVLHVGAEATFHPWGVDGVFPAEEADALVT